MKTAKIILAALTLSFFSIAVLHAGEKKIASNAKTQLSQELKASLSSVPYLGIMGEDDECCVKVTFTLNENNVISDVQVEGENEHLASYIRNRLSNTTVKTNLNSSGARYAVSIRFISK